MDRKILYTIMLFTVFIGIYLFSFYLSVKDTKDVKLDGYIFDKETKKPIPNTLVTIINNRYEDDKGNKNYDEYLGKDIIKLYSDSLGYYSTIIEKSAFVSLSFYKEGYIKKEVKGKYAEKNMNYRTFLKKGNVE